MAIVATVDATGFTAEQFRSISQQAGTATQLAAGNLFRAAGPIPGGWRVISAWESLEGFQTYMRERIRPAFERAGLEISRVEVWQVADARTGS